MHYHDPTRNKHKNKGRFSPNNGGLHIDIPQPKYVYDDLPTSAQWARWVRYYEKMLDMAKTQQRKWRNHELNPKKYS